MQQYRYVVKRHASMAIWAFYRNVALKYLHTYSDEDLIRNVRDAVRSMYRIETSLLRRKPIIKRWQGYHMAKAGNWYYAYTIDGDTITIHDACHRQNMHDE